MTTSDSGAASALSTSGADVTISTAAPPTINQALIATSSTEATWQDIAGAASSVPSITLHQEKILGANITAPDTDVAGLRITGLVIGQTYDIVAQVSQANTSGGGTGGTIFHDGVALFSYQEDGTAATETSTSACFSEYFVATATTCEWHAQFATGSDIVRGDGTKGFFGTWIQARHIVGASATTVKTLSANVTTTGVVSDLSFTGLTIGQEYELIGQMAVLIQGAVTCHGMFTNGDIDLMPFVYGGNGVEAVCTGVTSGVFIAEATTIDCNLLQAGGINQLEGDGTKGQSGCWVELRPISTGSKQQAGRILNSNITTTGIKEELSFDDLIIGRTYEIVGSVSAFASSSLCSADLKMNGVAIMGWAWEAEGGNEDFNMGVSSGSFTAKAVKVVWDQAFADGSQYVLGDGTPGRTGTQLKLRQLD
jgi:hypothetical protein